MDHFAKLIAALVLSFAGTAHAGYAQARPPSGWSPGNYAPSANDSVFGPIIHSPSGPTTTVGGQAVKMPASYRLAANAPRIAAGIIFAHPYVRTGVAIASWLGVARIVWDEVDKLWKIPRDDETIPKSDGFYWQAQGLSSTKSLTPSGACDKWYSIYAADGTVYRGIQDGKCVLENVYPGSEHLNTKFRGTLVKLDESSCPAGWSVTPAGCVQTPPPKTVTKKEFEDALSPKPMPDGVPLELPKPSPLPIEPQPVINPEPGPNPVPRPLFVPSGDPVPNPNFNPDAPPGPNNPPYIQPGTRVVPSPTPSQPWRVDHQPVNRPQDDATRNPNPDPEPGKDPADKPKPEEQQSLCEKHPDIVACARLGEPGQATPVPNETKTLTIAPENGFGPSGGSCPPPRTVEVAGLTLSMPFDLLCDFATGLKPVIVGLAWLTAAFTFMGIGRRS